MRERRFRGSDRTAQGNAHLRPGPTAEFDLLVKEVVLVGAARANRIPRGAMSHWVLDVTNRMARAETLLAAKRNLTAS